MAYWCMVPNLLGSRRLLVGECEVGGCEVGGCEVGAGRAVDMLGDSGR